MSKRRENIPLSVYIPGNSFIHRVNPAAKIAVVMLFVIVTSISFNTLWWGLSYIAVIGVLYVCARIPVRVAWSQTWPPLLFLLPLAGFQWWSEDFVFAAEKFLVLLSALLLAFLLTLTSTVAQIMDSVTTALSPLERIGVPVDTISLAMALTIRLIPLMFETVYEVLDARQARGATASPLAFGTPVIIRSIRRAQAIGEALAARGVGD
ncbi:cobalt ABC transporter permease [Corynebacterium phocae]|uniref:Cobalt ABC transporter permease n=1 Tax=Corynebacterium phocae TaxID=161895 RepID=A0A1L7D2Z1_9CORY|nr:energy-coupling factor transporter transmembrane protein EcfT [Corynebacterium phocae]APT92361.1 cobalt ABC transporter permease [Corynebacterium phocae]KAA8724952.1 energy-coupling factor transporter transmembrane protein EcfT [Corynebacterium phocae]